MRQRHLSEQTLQLTNVILSKDSLRSLDLQAINPGMHSTGSHVNHAEAQTTLPTHKPEHIAATVVLDLNMESLEQPCMTMQFDKSI